MSEPFDLAGKLAESIEEIDAALARCTTAERAQIVAHFLAQHVATEDPAPLLTLATVVARWIVLLAQPAAQAQA